MITRLRAWGAAATVRWSRRRKLALAVAGMVMFCLCGLGTVPIVMFLDHTDQQGDPPGTPVEAVDEYLLDLSPSVEMMRLRYLADDRQDELEEQRRRLVAEMKRTRPAVSRLNWSDFQQTPHGRDRVTVTVPVSGTWWSEGGSSGTSYESESHLWVFEVHREDGGWKIVEIRPPPWCGGYVRADACQ